ncbi:ANM_HP_G0118850.mRNA.1.CDS.1 [Saccharomyces cerevisiae]|nr:ANM_HP_G0118850.mRNA.1.CDS.1 [Saccharomyces cerevisiae]CAI6541705.1 ANM_HP_G0118850.mRNA.1.CDS.1 [Saccharomyces cerevisiae]
MLEEQLYLLACIFASRADTRNIKKLFTRLGSQSNYLEILCVLWPELDDPKNLLYLRELEEEVQSPEGEETTDEDVIVELLENDSSLIPLIESDTTTRSNRYHELQEFISKKLNNKTLENFEEWLRERILICNEMIPETPLLYSVLWETAKSKVLSTKFIGWVEGVLKPLDHLNKRLHLIFRINEWEKMPDSDLEKGVKDNSEASRKLQSNVVDILFHNSENLFNLSSLTHKLDELWSILSGFPDEITIEEQKTITALEMKQFMEFFIKCSTKFSFKEIFAITQEEESAQLAHFSSLCHEEFNKANEISSFLQAMYETVLDISKDDKIFTRISMDEKLYSILEILLQMNEFAYIEAIIERFDYSNNTQIYELLVKFFWHFFNNASNGLRKEPEMKKASQTLQIIQKHMSQRAGTNLTKLEVLLEISDKLSHYSINLNKSHNGARDTAFKPSNILEYRDCPLDIISNLLELNPRLYKDLPTTKSLLFGIYDSLSINREGQTGKVEVDLMVLHIDYALVNLDFGTAYELGKQVFEICQEAGQHMMKALGDEHWLTFYQMGKFDDPNWVDNEIPTEIIVLQMSILGRLLEVCPLEEVEIVTSQWSTLELELSARDLVKDKDFIIWGLSQVFDGDTSLLNGMRFEVGSE